MSESRKWECVDCQHIQKVEPPAKLPDHCPKCSGDRFRPVKTDAEKEKS